MRLTLARRVCVYCRRTHGLALWGWKGRPLVTSHGVCRGCLARSHAACERGDRVVAAPVASRPSPIASDFLC